MLFNLNIKRDTNSVHLRLITLYSCEKTFMDTKISQRYELIKKLLLLVNSWHMHDGII